jgi:hypothetical protein
MNDTGIALVVWTHYESTPTVALRGLWGSHSIDGGVTWSAPARIFSAAAAWATVPLAMDAAGNARVAWEEYTANITRLWSASFNATTRTWSAPAVVKPGVNSWDHYAHLAIAPTGAGLLVWNQADANGDDSVWASSFTTPTGALSTPVEVDAFSGDDTYIPSVTIAPDGTRGLVVWEQDTATTGEVWGNDWTPGAGFAGAKKIISASLVGEPSVAMDKNYTTTLVWTQPITGGRWNMMAARRALNQAWGTTTALESTNFAPGRTDEYSYGQVGVDRYGTAHVLWRRKVAATGNTFSVVVRTFTNNIWQPEVVLGQKAGLPAYIFPQLAVGDDGHAAATWYYTDPDATGDPDTYNIFVSLYQ